MASLAELAISLDTKNLEAGLQKLDGLSKKSGAAEVATSQLKKESISLATTQAKLTSVTDKLAKETNDDAKAAMLAEQANLEYSVALGKVNVQSQATAIATGKAATGGKKMSNSLRQASMQLSQVAQQGSVTGNYLQALAIQLPDLALGLGTVGIIAGAVAGSLAIPLINALKGSTAAFDDMNKSIREGTADLRSFSKAQKAVFSDDQVEKIKETEEKIQDYTDEIDSATRQLNQHQTMLDKLVEADSIWGGNDIARYTTLIEKLEKKIQSTTAKRDAQNTSLAKQKGLLEEVNSEISKADLASIYEGQIDSLIQAEDKFKAVRDGLETPAERSLRQMRDDKTVLADAYSRNIIDFKTYKENKKRVDEEFLADELARTKAAEAQKLQILSANQQAGLGIVSNLFGQMADIARQGGEEQFQEYKNFASAQAAVSTALAVNNALAVAPTPVGIALASVVGAMGVAQIAMIQGQQYQGARAMGGQVEGSGRYLVGENGPEVLQLGAQGGSITPNHALQGGGPSVTNVFNIQSGVTRQEVAGLIPTIVNATKQAVKSDMSSGGSMSKAVGRRA